MIRQPRPDPMSRENRDTPSILRETTGTPRPGSSGRGVDAAGSRAEGREPLSPVPAAPGVSRLDAPSAPEGAALILTRLTSILGGGDYGPKVCLLSVRKYFLACYV